MGAAVEKAVLKVKEAVTPAVGAHEAGKKSLGRLLVTAAGIIGRQ